MYHKEITDITNNNFIAFIVPSDSSIVSVCALLSTTLYCISTILHIKNEMTQNNTKEKQNDTEEKNDIKESESIAVNSNKVNLSNIKTPEQFRKNNKNRKDD